MAFGLKLIFVWTMTLPPPLVPVSFTTSMNPSLPIVVVFPLNRYRKLLLI